METPVNKGLVQPVQPVQGILAKISCGKKYTKKKVETSYQDDDSTNLYFTLDQLDQLDQAAITKVFGGPPYPGSPGPNSSTPGPNSTSI
ncbi:hypothetical protein [Desulfobacter sp.]|uniref:hypothetical protein n=1 Tax=Desulfobacter sp. TaxID=2294 RepID=UPI003D14647A